MTTKTQAVIRLPLWALAIRASPLVLILSTTFLLVLAIVPTILVAGTGGVPGGCAFVTTVNGKPQYKACTGINIQMWYSASSPTYNPGGFACGDYGNQDCGQDLGDPMNE